MLDELQPVLWKRPQSQKAVYLSNYSSCHMYRQKQLQTAPNIYLDILQSNFSSSSAVLLPTANGYLKEVKVMVKMRQWSGCQKF